MQCGRDDRVPELMLTLPAVPHQEQPARIVFGVHGQAQYITPQSANLYFDGRRSPAKCAKADLAVIDVVLIVSVCSPARQAAKL